MSDASLTTGRPAVSGGERTNTAPPREAGARTIDARVIGHDRTGAAVLDTAAGRLALAQDEPLAVGTRLTLLIRPDGSIRTISAPPVYPEVGTGSGGDLVRPGSFSTARGMLSGLLPGTLLEVRILHHIRQEPAASLPAGASATDLRPGDLLVVRLEAARTADGGEISASRLPGEFIAKVTGDGRQLRLVSALGSLELADAASSFPPRLILRVAPLPAPAAGPAAAPFGMDAPPTMAEAWPALASLLGDRAASDPGLASLLRKDLPQPGDSFAGQVIRILLGMAAEEAPETALARLLPQLAARPEASHLQEVIGEDLQRHARWAEPANEWRTFVLPVADGERLVPFQLHLRHSEGGASGEAGDAGARFMIDVDLSRLGAIQLDGFYRRRQLFLTIRSGRRLPRGFGERLKEIFDRTLLAADMAGELRIENDTQPIPNPRTAALADRAGVAKMRA